MTHRFPSSLLEDFVDNELSEEELADFKRLLESSPELRDEHQLAVRLKELMKKQPVPDPGEDYWSEVTELILARTTGAPDNETTVTSQEELSNRRSAFLRSLVSAAAALFILFSALVIGSGKHHQMLTENISANSVLLTASVADEINSDSFVMMTKAERNSATIGLLMLGPPSPVGRFAALPMLLNGE
jgi:anti-sigma factor RsiW